jgi:hypothetical protein
VGLLPSEQIDGKILEFIRQGVLYKQLETSSRGKTLTTTRLRRDHPNVERILGQMLLDPDGRPLASDDDEDEDDDGLDAPYEQHVPRVLGAHAWPPDMRE